MRLKFIFLFHRKTRDISGDVEFYCSHIIIFSQTALWTKHEGGFGWLTQRLATSTAFLLLKYHSQGFEGV